MEGLHDSQGRVQGLGRVFMNKVPDTPIIHYESPTYKSPKMRASEFGVVQGLQGFGFRESKVLLIEIIHRGFWWGEKGHGKNEWYCIN